MPQAGAHHVTLSMESFSQHLFPSLLMQNTRISSETEVRQLVTHLRDDNNGIYCHVIIMYK